MHGSWTELETFVCQVSAEVKSARENDIPHASIPPDTQPVTVIGLLDEGETARALNVLRKKPECAPMPATPDVIDKLQKQLPDPEIAETDHDIRNRATLLQQTREAARRSVRGNRTPGVRV